MDFNSPAHLCRHIYDWNIVACNIKHQYNQTQILYFKNKTNQQNKFCFMYQLKISTLQALLSHYS